MLEVPQWLLTEMHAEVQRTYPEEGCGMVARRVVARSVLTDYLHVRMKNISGNPRFAYQWGEGQQVDLWDAMEDKGVEPWVVYHSHTESLPEPSTIDQGAAWLVGAHYLIFGLAAGPEDVFYRSWRCTEPGHLEAEEVRVI